MGVLAASLRVDNVGIKDRLGNINTDLRNSHWVCSSAIGRAVCSPFTLQCVAAGDRSGSIPLVKVERIPLLTLLFLSYDPKCCSYSMSSGASGRLTEALFY